jgi:hypothetical protein
MRQKIKLVLKSMDMKRLFIFFLLICSNVYASFEVAQVNFGIGMINSSFTENPSGLKPSAGTKPEVVASGAVSTISGFIDYEKFLNSKISIVGKTTFPLIPASTGSYMHVGGAMNYYFSPIASSATFSSKDLKISFNPSWRYYAGGGLGGAYLIYNTLSAQKTDTQIELFGQAGAIYNQSERWGYRAEFIMARGVGFNTSSMTMKILFGLCYLLN